MNSGHAHRARSLLEARLRDCVAPASSRWRAAECGRHRLPGLPARPPAIAERGRQINRVAELVAEGLTNPQIAERMFISKATVKTHLAHVFRKLDVHSRVELSARALERQDTAR